MIDGLVGSLVNLLDKCLVAGYGATVAAGWTKPFTGTNAAVFKAGAGLGYALDVNDNGPGAGGGQEARLRGYEVMTAVATGTNPFPTVAQLANGVFCRKSVAASATTRVWHMIADERTFYLDILTGDVANSYFRIIFGDIFSYKTSFDPGGCLIAGRVVENSGTAINENADIYNIVSAVTTGHYLARDAAGTVGAIPCGKMTDPSTIAVATGLGLVAFTNPADNLVIAPPVRINHTSGGNTVRGRMRGAWNFAHPVTACSDGDTYTGQDDAAGRTFAIRKFSVNQTVYVIETSDTWDSN